MAVTLTMTLNTYLCRLRFPFAYNNYKLWTVQFLIHAKNQKVANAKNQMVGLLVGLDRPIFDRCQKSDGPPH